MTNVPASVFLFLLSGPMHAFNNYRTILVVYGRMGELISGGWNKLLMTNPPLYFIPPSPHALLGKCCLYRRGLGCDVETA